MSINRQTTTKMKHSKEWEDSWIYKGEPLLVLGVEARGTYGDTVEPTTEEDIFKNPADWKLIRHQTGGMFCNQVKLFGRVFPVKKELLGNLYRLDKKYYDSFVTRMKGFGKSTSLATLNEYNEFLGKELGVTCGHAYGSFEEGFYPIDSTSANLEQLTGIKIEDFTEEFLKKPEEGKGIDSLFSMGQYYNTNWILAVLGENSD